MMTMRKLRVYADTSVFGGCFDEEFAEASRMFFDQVGSGRFVLVTSPIVEAAANVLNGFHEIAIHSPREVLKYEEEGL